MRLLTTNSKLAKARDYGYLAVGLELAPGKLAGRGEACPARGDCYRTCIFSSGFGAMTSVRKARIDRHRLMFNTDGQLNQLALDQLISEIKAAQRKAVRLKLKLAVRLNVFSDISWENVAPALFMMFPDVQFYDYTKIVTRARRYVEGKLPFNYHLTFSISEYVPLYSDTERLLRVGDESHVQRMSVALPLYQNVKAIWLPSTYARHVDGDKHDLTFLHPAGSIILLSAKGKAGSRNPKPNKFLVK